MNFMGKLISGIEPGLEKEYLPAKGPRKNAKWKIHPQSFAFISRPFRGNNS
jgi:hypothetical protein